MSEPSRFSTLTSLSILYQPPVCLTALSSSKVTGEQVLLSIFFSLAFCLVSCPWHQLSEGFEKVTFLSIMQPFLLAKVGSNAYQFSTSKWKSEIFTSYITGLLRIVY